MEIDNSYYHQLCPLCSSSKIRHLGIVHYPEKNIFSTKIIKLIKDAELWSCFDCDSKFLQHIMPEDIAMQLYRSASSEIRWGSEKPFSENKNNEIIETLEKYFFKGKIVVDVGCNSGLLLDFARGFGAETIGIEPSEGSKKLLLSKEHKICDALDCLDDNSVDVITAFDLVEHLYDVNLFFSKCNIKLKKNGFLIILTGNPQCLSARLAKNNWWYASYPEHIVFPSKRYYESLPGYSVNKYIKTYASIGYFNSKPKLFLFMFKYIVKKFLKPRKYIGLPSLGPDHHLVVLKK